MDPRKKALADVRGMADESLLSRLRALKAPAREEAGLIPEPEMSEDEAEELRRYYEGQSKTGA